MRLQSRDTALGGGASGDWIALVCQGESVQAFVPRALPPSPPVAIEGELRLALDRALLALGRLDSAATLLADAPLFARMLVRKEALLSSWIAGTRVSLLDLLLVGLDQEPESPVADVRAVARYAVAFEFGLRRLREGLPVSTRLIRELHRQLLYGSEGANRTPGEFRAAQSWVGGASPGLARYVPPPPESVGQCMKDLERYVHEPADATPLLVKTAWVHAQLESIQPFVEGNGRLVRLLTTLLLGSEGVLREPLLTPSRYLEAHCSERDDLLGRVRRNGDWAAWLHFFADGVRESAEDALVTARRIADRFERDRWQIQGHGRAVGFALRVLRELQQRPLTSIPRLVDTTGLSASTISTTLRKLASAGIVREFEGDRHPRLFAHDRYLALLGEGEPR